MRSTQIFFAYMVGCLLIAAILSDPLLQSPLIDEEPQRILARLAQILMLLGLWPLLRLLRLNQRAALGFDESSRLFRHKVLLGWVLGVLMMSVIVALLLASGARVFEYWEPGFVLGVVKAALRALLAGLLIALLEEIFFRGALFAHIRRRSPLSSAAAWSAALYAAVHFMKPSELPVGMPVDLSAIIWMVVSVFAGLFDWEHLDSLSALFLAGLLLALLRERTGSLALGIGLHAGWVFTIQTTRRLTDGNENTSWAWLAGDYDGVIGWLAAAVLGFIIVIERLSANHAKEREVADY